MQELLHQFISIKLVFLLFSYLLMNQEIMTSSQSYQPLHFDCYCIPIKCTTYQWRIDLYGNGAVAPLPYFLTLVIIE